MHAQLYDRGIIAPRVNILERRFMKRSVALFCTLLFALSCTLAFGQGKPIVSAGYVASDGAHASIHVVRHANGTVSGSGQWRYPDSAQNLTIEVDQAEFSADGKSVYLSGNVYSAGFSFIPRYVIKLIDSGEGFKASDTDRESYMIIDPSPLWTLGNPFARFLLDTPAAYGLADWFAIRSGNIQVHKE